MKHRMAAILPAHLFLYATCLYTAWLLRFDFVIAPEMSRVFWNVLPFVLLIKTLICLATGEYKRTYRYSTMADVLCVVYGTVAAACGMYIQNWTGVLGVIPRSIILIDAGLTILSVGFLRMAIRFYTESFCSWLVPRTRETTLIYGCDSTSIGILRGLQTAHTGFRIVGFVDEADAKQSLVAGVPVVSTSLGWSRIVRKFGARHVLIPGTTPGGTIRKILREVANVGMKAHVIPGVGEIVEGRYKMGIRDVTISDLLRREPAELDFASIRNYVTGRRVLVTGAAGSIGSELVRQILALGPDRLVLLDQSELGIFTMEQELQYVHKGETEVCYIMADVVDRACLERAFREQQPELVFHAAAYKHVPLMESNPREAIRNNVMGTKNVVDLSDEYGVERVVLISTDKAVRPSSVMGATKLMAERYLQAKSTISSTKMITVRFGNVLNSAGSVVPTFRRQIEAGGPVTVTDPEMERFFMTIPEAVQLVLQAGAVGESGDILILEMGDPVKIFDLAKDMINLSGLRYPEDIDVVFTGVRPGEKLYEELFYQSEENAKRVREKIFCAASDRPQMVDVSFDIGRLQAAIAGTRADATKVLWETVANHVAHNDHAGQDTRKAA